MLPKVQYVFLLNLCPCDCLHAFILEIQSSDPDCPLHVDESDSQATVYELSSYGFFFFFNAAESSHREFRETTW